LIASSRASVSGVEIEPAAFDQRHAERLARQLESQRDPRGPATDDADLGLDDGAVLKRARIDVHRNDPVVRIGATTSRPAEEPASGSGV
jgi:hypothetical protein